MEYAIIFTQTVQTSEDTWDAVKRVIMVNENTTIAQIEQAYRKVIGSPNGEMWGSISPMVNVAHMKPDEVLE